jgi:hypothetical protein
VRRAIGESIRTAGALAVMIAALACAGVLLTAPAGSSCTLIPNPTFVPANGGVSVITTVVTEPAGTPVANGTVILYFTDLGTIDRQGKTKDGVARVNFISDSRSGIANITASCGGAAPAVTNPSPNPSASATAPPTGGGSGSGTAKVTVGNANVAALRLRADPPRITISNSTHVFAVVIGANGNPIANVPVYFSVADTTVAPSPGTGSPAPAGGTEFFDLQGPVFTNNNGEAENVMRTRRTTTGSAAVKASAPGPTGFIDSNTLLIPIL